MIIPSKMKCPYKTIVEHIPEIVEEGRVIRNAEERTTFGNCDYDECPYYRQEEYRPANKIYRHCRKAEGK